MHKISVKTCIESISKMMPYHFSMAGLDSSIESTVEVVVKCEGHTFVTTVDRFSIEHTIHPWEVFTRHFSDTYFKKNDEFVSVLNLVVDNWSLEQFADSSQNKWLFRISAHVKEIWDSVDDD